MRQGENHAYTLNAWMVHKGTSERKNPRRLSEGGGIYKQAVNCCDGDPELF